MSIKMKSVTHHSEDQVRKCLRAMRGMEHVSDETVALIASVGMLKQFRSGENIWRVGDPGEFLAIVVEGLIEVTRQAGEDDNAIIGLFGPNDVIGLPAVLGRSAFPGTARVITSGTEVVKCYVRPLLQGSSHQTLELHSWLRENLLLHTQILQDKIDILGAGTAEKKIMTLFLHLLRRFGQKETHLRYRIPLKLTRDQVARLTKTRVETVIRLCSAWKRQHLIQWTKTGILIENVSAVERATLSN